MTFALNKFGRFLPAATFAMAAEYLMGLSDSVICGHVIGENGLAAINLMQPPMSVVAFFAILVGTGASVLFAVEAGKFEKRRASEYLTQGLWSALMFGALLTVLFVLFRVPVAESFGVEGEVLAGVKEYWLWYIPCAMLEPLAVFLASICYADGDDKVCLWSYAGQLGVNLGVSWFLTHRFGFAGCAVGTGVGLLSAIVILLGHFRKKTNSLHFVMHFSLADTLRICKCSLGDASSRLSTALLVLSLNLYTVARFGAEALPVLAVAVAVIGLAEAFDGVSRAMQPIASVYIGERNDRLVKRIITYAEIASGAEGLFLTVLLAVFPSIALKLVGIEDPAIVPKAETAVRIVAFSLVGTSFVTLFNSYWMFMGKEFLSFTLTTLAMLVAPVALFPAMGRIFGINGVWAALALSPYAALAVSGAIVCMKWGRKALPHFLDKSRARHTRVYDLKLAPETICDLSERINKFLLTRKGVGERKATLTALLVEEALMVVNDRNASRPTRAEVSLVFGDGNILLTIRDDGDIFDITDADAKISSLRSYLVSNLMIAIPARRNMTTTGFNRNAFKI